MKWLFYNVENDADSFARGAAWVIIIALLALFLIILTGGCATTNQWARLIDCNAFSSDGEKAACEKGKAESAQELQEAREQSAYQQGRGGYDSSGWPVGYWPIVTIGVRTWSGYNPYYYNNYYYYYNNSRRGPHENYGPNSPACRYANMCD